MNKALIYCPNNRKLTWFAFACALTIHLAAIAIAENKSKPVTVSWDGELDNPVVGILDAPPQPDDPDIALPPEQPENNEQDFVEENVRRLPLRQRRKTPIAAAIHLSGMGMGKATSASSAKALTLYAPKPNYPYEARRSGTIGSGVAQLTVNPAGDVIAARMAQSTGNVILDNATLEALRRWRFKLGVRENISVPITYTLSGVSY